MVKDLRRWERIVYLIVLLLAVFSRFYILGERAISHDESIHTKFAWNLYAGQGFRHNPMMHGPLLFEATALSYFLFGVSDFTARLFTALVGVALVMAPLLLRKWLGRSGAAVASVLLLISPSISYYSRYIRHDVLLLLTAVLWLWTLLRYLDSGQARWLYWMAAFFSLMYATKEASYIYTAIFGALLFLPFAWQVFNVRWKRSDWFLYFVAALALTLVLAAVFGLSFVRAQVNEHTLDDAGNTRMTDVEVPWWGRTAAGLAFLLLLGAVVLGYYGVGARTMARLRLFDVLMLVGSLTLPLGSAFLIKLVAGVDMNGVYDAVVNGNLSLLPRAALAAMLSILALTAGLSVLLGMWWDPERWPIAALIHYGIFFLLYTTLFTWGYGALSGLVGGLAYWMAQQGVARGGQPPYYYALFVPLYEYLVVLGSLGAGVAALWHGIARRPPRTHAVEVSDEGATLPDTTADAAPPVLDLERWFPAFLLGWTLLSWIAYTLAGEKMPWLMVHIALPSVFLAAWGLGQLIDGLEGATWMRRRGWVALLALPLAVTGLLVFARGGGALLRALRPGISPAGPTLAQLAPFGQLLGGLLGTVVFGGVFVIFVRRLPGPQVARGLGLFAAALLAALTVRTSMQLNFINYGLAKEFMVYAHATPDVKTALQQIEDVSWHVTGSPHNVRVAFGEDGSWPFYWYMVHYPNHYFYSTSPDPEQLLDCPVVIAGTPQYTVVEEVLGDAYMHFEYKYLWWPIQDYYNLTWDRIRNALFNPAMRSALWDIIWRRDYRQYAQLKNPTDPFTLQTWPYRKGFRLYVRRDLAQETWPYQLGASGPHFARPKPTEPPDPYVAGTRELPLVTSATLPQSSVRGIARASDGTLYAADTTAHRVWHITPQGTVLDTLGEYGPAPGQFSEPWDVALDAEGNLYVADTWNHRVQVFAPDGTFLRSWGTLGQVQAADDPTSEGVFFGPRGIAIGPEGEVYVTDTGNKRVQVFDAQGNYLRAFGGPGAGPGQMDEPVGIALSAAGEVYVADTWNRRIQVFTRDGVFVRQWRVFAWGTENPEEKPFLAVDGELVYASDPAHGRVLVFDTDGAFRWALSSGDAAVGLTFPEGLALEDGVLYVADAHAQRVLGYSLP